LVKVCFEMNRSGRKSARMGAVAVSATVESAVVVVSTSYASIVTGSVILREVVSI